MCSNCHMLARTAWNCSYTILLLHTHKLLHIKIFQTNWLTKVRKCITRWTQGIVVLWGRHEQAACILANEVFLVAIRSMSSLDWNAVHVLLHVPDLWHDIWKRNASHVILHAPVLWSGLYDQCRHAHACTINWYFMFKVHLSPNSIHFTRTWTSICKCTYITCRQFGTV